MVSQIGKMTNHSYGKWLYPLCARGADHAINDKTLQLGKSTKSITKHNFNDYNIVYAYYIKACCR